MKPYMNAARISAVVFVSVLSLLSANGVAEAAAASYSAEVTQNASSFSTTFRAAAGFSGNYLFDIEIWKGSQRVFQDFETRTVQGSSTSIQRPMPNDLNGAYVVKAGVFSPDWSTKYFWNENAGAVNVSPLSFTAISTTSGSQLQTIFTASRAVSGTYLLDVELYSGGSRMFQAYDSISFSGTSIAFSRTLPAPVRNGAYVAKAGVFTPDWGTKFLWTDNSGNVTVPGATAPTTTTSTVPPTTTSTTAEPTTTTSPTTMAPPTTTTTIPPTTTTSTTSTTVPPPTTTTVLTTTTVPTTTTTTVPPPTATTTSMPPSSGPVTFTAAASITGTTFKTVFTANRALSGQYLLDVELWNGGNRSYQYFETQTMLNSNTITINKTLPVTIASGTFTVKAGVFSSDWSTKYLWSDNAGSVTVSPVNAQPMTYSATSAAAGNNLQTIFTTSKPLTGQYLFDIELFSGGNRVYQYFETFQVDGSSTFGVTRTLPSWLQSGTYTVKVGIFSPYWSTKYYWSDNAGTVKTGSGALALTTALQRSGSALSTTFTNPASFTNTHVLALELWNSNNIRVSRFTTTQDLRGLGYGTVTTSIPPGLANGSYSVRAGVLSADGKTPLYWNENVGTVAVTSPPRDSANAAAPAGPTGSWNLAFNDEFNGESLDTTKWLPCSRQMLWTQNQCMGHGSELQSYSSDALSMANFSDGSHGLRLTAKNDGSTWAFGHDNVSAGAPQFSSGMVSTSPNTMGYSQPGYQPFSYTYGFYEVRMKVPGGQGLWPAAWMFPEDNVGPAELDLAEILGYDTSTNYMTVHRNGGNSMEAARGIDFSAGFHTFGMDWQPDHVSWFIDGVRARTDYTDAATIPSKPMYAMVNLAVGGVWPGDPDSTTPKSSQMDIDWVRIWKRQD